MLDVLKLFAPTLLTLCVGGFWLNRLFIARANLASLVERLCDALDELRDDCAEYWSVPYDEEKEAELSVLEATIKGRLQQISSLIDLIGDKHPALPPVVHSLMVNLLDACTGGEFESKTRKADKGRFMRIVSSVYKLAVELQRLKIWTGKISAFIDEQCRDFRSNSPDGGSKII